MNKKKMACFLMALVMTISVISIHTLAEEKVKLHIMKTVTKGQIDMERSNILELENRLGVELEVEIPPTSAYQERIRTLFSIGQKLPDIICDIPTDMVADLLEAGIIIPLESYLENTTYLKELYAQMPGYLTANTYDGHLACFPIMGYNRGIGGSFIRLDWLENLELTHLVDLENCRIKLEDLETILHAFTFNDPDQNGENDTYGWGMPAPNHWTTYVPNLIQGAFGAGYGMKRADDGHYYDATLEDQWENYLEAMRYFKKLITMGVVDPEAFTLTREQFRERWYAGKVGTEFTFGSSTSYNSFYSPMAAINPAVKLTWIQNLEGEGGRYETYVNGLNNSNLGIFITSSCKNPEKAVELIDYCVSPEGRLLIEVGIENEHYTMVNGAPALTTNEQIDLMNSYTNAKLEFVTTQSFSDHFQYAWLLQPENVRDKLVAWRKCESQGYILNDNLRIALPVYDRIDRFTEYENQLSQEVLKYLTTPDLGEEGVQAARDAFVESREYREYWEMVTETYKESGIK